MIIDGEESKISPSDTVQRQHKYPDTVEPIIDPAITRNLFQETKAAYASFKATLYAEYLEWTSSSKPNKELLRHSYCKKF